MQQQQLGKKLCLALALALSGCRSSQPPKIEICIGDGVGGANCVESDGSNKYRLPSELQNYWMTNENDETNFASWCYDTTPQNIETANQKIMEVARP